MEYLWLYLFIHIKYYTNGVFMHSYKIYTGVGTVCYHSTTVLYVSSLLHIGV